MKLYNTWPWSLATMILASLTSSFVPFNYEVRAEEEAPGQVKAVSESSPENGFKLLPNALKNIGVVTKPVEIVAGMYTFPSSALVHSLDQLVVYRLRNGWFKLIPVDLIREETDQISFRSSEIQAGDQVAIQGVGLLRVADMEAFGGGE